MSDIYITPEEYAERYASRYGCTIEEAKQTAVYKEVKNYIKERGCVDANNTIRKTDNQEEQSKDLG